MSRDFNETYESLPYYLKRYCVDQDYDAYTPANHAAWRYIMRQNKAFFSKHAVSVYEDGLRQTGISIERIPRISEMDQCLRQFGWGAVPVCGFIPSAAFLEFQSRGILAIACDMRTVEHIEYTPAPDIVHEAAGHAPIIADRDYSEYLKRYAKMAHQSIISKDDVNVYEAIRYLSDIKENPDTAPGEIEKAEQRFQDAVAAVSHVSEAARVGRMAWWTVEYGLVGDLKQHKIYGAGLLSSVGESQNCLSDKVKKIPLTIECTDQAFDITKPQPQLFVAKNMQNLVDVLDELDKTMAYQHGGRAGLDKAVESKLVNTVVLDSGMQISGRLEKYEADGETVDFYKFNSKVQLAYEGQQLPGHGTVRHPDGFSSPLGRWKNMSGKPACEITDAEMQSLGLVRGRIAELEFVNGFKVRGLVAGWHRIGGKLMYMTWRRCTVTRGDQVYFQPEWGEFDLAVGEKVTSVFGGPAAWDEYGEFEVGNASTAPGRTSPYTDEEMQVFSIYDEVRQLRDRMIELSTEDAQAKLDELADRVLKNHTDEWLLALEVVEMAACLAGSVRNIQGRCAELNSRALEQKSTDDSVVDGLISKGLQLLQ